MADFAVGLSRMLYGVTMPSERPGHRMYEQWHPLGPVGVITAFNFPVAVWSWNAFIALVCGDTVVWKPSSKAALSAISVMRLIWPVLKKNGLPDGILNLVVGSGPSIGEAMVQDRRLPLISATGSVRMGRHVATAVASRLGADAARTGRQQRGHRLPQRGPGTGCTGGRVRRQGLRDPLHRGGAAGHADRP